MNAATTTQQKQIGDRVRVTAGQHKNAVGRITGKERRGWTITLEDGAQATMPFPMVALVEETGTEAVAEAPETPAAAIPTDGEAGESTVEPEADAPAQPKRNRRKAAQPDASGSGETGKAATEVSQMTVKELWALAKQRGVSVARTKSDFFRIIKAMNPDEDLTVLKGQKLFDRVKELHISRLRSKHEMARLLSA